MMFDITGRLVRVLEAAGAARSGPRSVEWDGRDRSGRPVPAGVYLARTDGDSGRQEGRVVIIR
jgi:flagellar hook assembly protein FlgD